MQDPYDVLVVGGGPAGYVAAIRAAQFGARVALAERDRIGGTCLNRGCVPTKSYLETAHTAWAIRNGSARGLLVDTPPRVDMKRVLAVKNDAVRRLTGGVKALLASRKVDVFAGRAELAGPGRVEVEGTGTLRARSVILAGGSVSSRLPVPGAGSPRVLLSEDILDLEALPSSLVVIGGGVIGVEIAQAFSAFGSRVSIVEIADRILPGMDAGLSKAVAESLARRGIPIHTGVAVQALEEAPGSVTVRLADGRSIEGEYALLSVGRRPDLSCLGTSGVETDRGRVVVNDRMETNLPGVLAPGDLNGLRMLAHAAFAMGESSAETALGRPRIADLRTVPSVVYGMPEAASVGRTEEEARSYRDDVSVGYFPFSANGRSVASGDTEGFVKVLAEPRFGELLGVHIVGSGASELINEAAVLMRMEVTAFELADVFHAHPTRSEALQEAAADALGRCIHLPARG